MVTPSDTDSVWQDLNAYVDGELSPERASAMAEAIAKDRQLARQAASLSRMKVGVAAAVELPPHLQHLPGTSRQPPRHGTFAAAVALLLAVGGVIWLQVGGRPVDWFAAPEEVATRQDAWLDQAMAVHHDLSGQSFPATAARPTRPARFAGLLPDLSSAELKRGPVRSVQLPALGGGTAVQYRGSRGCRVSLIALETGGEALPESLHRQSTGSVEAFRWRVGAIGYLLLAEGMDAGRLLGIAESVYDATRRFRPLDEEARTRLAEARSRSEPCQA